MALRVLLILMVCGSVIVAEEHPLVRIHRAYESIVAAEADELAEVYARATVGFTAADFDLLIRFHLATEAERENERRNMEKAAEDKTRKWHRLAQKEIRFLAENRQDLQRRRTELVDTLVDIVTKIESLKRDMTL